MNKSDLVTRVAKQSSLTRHDAERAVNAVFDGIGDALAAGDKVQVVGFGVFETRKRAARTGRNPQTGGEVSIPETTVPAFKPGGVLKDKVK